MFTSIIVAIALVAWAAGCMAGMAIGLIVARKTIGQWNARPP